MWKSRRIEYLNLRSLINYLIRNFQFIHLMTNHSQCSFFVYLSLMYTEYTTTKLIAPHIIIGTTLIKNVPTSTIILALISELSNEVSSITSLILDLNSRVKVSIFLKMNDNLIITLKTKANFSNGAR